MTDKLIARSPVDGRVYVERPLAKAGEIARSLEDAISAARSWKLVPLADRAALVEKAVDAFVANREAIAEEISWQMGRPVSQSPGELRGFEERARYMISVAGDALRDVDVAEKAGFRRFIRREPLGVVFAIV